MKINLFLVTALIMLIVLISGCGSIKTISETSDNLKYAECNSKEKPIEKEDCFAQLAIEKNDPTICAMIQESSLDELNYDIDSGCRSKYAVAVGNEEICVDIIKTTSNFGTITAVDRCRDKFGQDWFKGVCNKILQDKDSSSNSRYVCKQK